MTFTVTIKGTVRGGISAEAKFNILIIPKVSPPIIFEKEFDKMNMTQKKIKKVEMIPNLDPKISKIAIDGKVTIKFQKEMNFSSNLTNFSDLEALSLYVEFRATIKPNL